MSVGLLKTTPLGNGRVFCSFRVNSTVRALVKLYADATEFDFLVEYLKLMQTVTTEYSDNSTKRRIILCAPLHALDHLLVESQGDGQVQFRDILTDLASDVFNQLEPNTLADGPCVFIPFQCTSSSLQPEAMEKQGLIIAYMSLHHLSHWSLSSDPVRAFLCNEPEQRPLSAPPKISAYSDHVVTSESGYLKDSISGASSLILSCHQGGDMPSSQDPGEFDWLNKLQTNESKIRSPKFELYGMLSLAQLQDCCTPCQKIVYEYILPSKVSDEKSADLIKTTSCQMDYSSLICRCPTYPDAIYHWDHIDLDSSTDANSNNNTTGHRRCSLTIVSPKMSLDEMMNFARGMRLPNGTMAINVPLPIATIRFNIGPLKDFVSKHSFWTIEQVLLNEDSYIYLESILL